MARNLLKQMDEPVILFNAEEASPLNEPAEKLLPEILQDRAYFFQLMEQHKEGTFFRIQHAFKQGAFDINFQFVKSPDIHGWLAFFHRAKELDTGNEPFPAHYYYWIVENSTDVYMIFDQSHRHLFVNSYVTEQTAIPRMEFIGKTHKELGFPEDLVEIWDLHIEKVFSSGQHSRVQFQLPNGTWIDWLLNPLFLDGESKPRYVLAYAREVSHLKSVEKDLQEAQSHLLDAFRIAKMATWEIDVAKDHILLNPRFCDVIGVPFPTDANKRYITGEFYFGQIVHEDYRQDFLDTYRRVLKDMSRGQRVVYEYKIRRGDTGREIVLLATIAVERDQDGKAVRCYGTTQDVTEHRRAEMELHEYRFNLERLVQQRTRQLKESQDKLHDALSLAHLGAWEFDFSKQSFLVSGSSVPRMLGIEVQDQQEAQYELSLEDFKKYIFPEDWHTFQEATERALQSNDPNYLDYVSYRIRRADGDVRNLYVSIKVTVGEDGLHEKHFGTIQDITEITRMESEKNRLTDIINATPDIVGIADKDFKIYYLNDAGKSFFGVKDVKGLPVEQLIPTPEKKESRKFIRKAIKKAKKKGYWQGEYQLLKPNGDAVDASLLIIAHKNYVGELEYISTIIRDISEQKHTEKELLYKNQELDTFVYRASHDLRGPITSLQGLLNVAQYEIKEEKPRQYLDMLGAQVDRLNNIIISLMEITKIKEKDPIYDEVDFGSLIDDVIASFSSLQRFEDVKFDLQIEKELHYKGDLNLLDTIIRNLVENGIKYSRKEVNSFVKIEVFQRLKPHRLCIRVTDNGQGIPQKLQEKVFNMFFRGNDKAMGSGLGLYILKNAVEKLNGSVQLSSAIGEGSTFTIWLPYKG